jgi:hypothetical protein
MPLFNAPEWESGATPVVTPSFAGKRSGKRKRAPTFTDDNTGGDPTNLSTSTGPSPNLQKMMRKMRLSRDKRNAAMERLKPSASIEESLMARKNGTVAHIITNMDPPQTPSSIFAESSSPQTPGVNGQPVNKKPRIRREDSDVLPPSSAGDETEPAHVLAEIRKRKRSKRARRTISSEPTALKVSPEANSQPESDEETSRPSRPPAAWSVSENEDMSQDSTELTELQRKMKQKLSGGRFRYAQCIHPFAQRFMSRATE